MKLLKTIIKHFLPDFDQCMKETCKEMDKEIKIKRGGLIKEIKKYETTYNKRAVE